MRQQVKSLFQWVLVIGLAFSMSGCLNSSFQDITVESKKSQTIDFTGYDSYAWLASATVLRDTQGAWKPKEGFDADLQIKYAIDTELRALGKSEVSAGPDFFVAFAAGVDMDAFKEKVDDAGEKILANVPSAALVIMFIDAHTQQLIWLGSATAEVNSSNTAQTSKARINYAVGEMFETLQ